MEGSLVMADISGYTAFVAGTEQEHSREILAELMEAIARSFGGKLTVEQVEGNALCCTTERSDVEVADWLRETFRLFHRRLRDILTATSCPCRACATVQGLGLKFVVHRGSFSRYEVAGRVQLHGNDVNLVHRLLKNTVRCATPYGPSRGRTSIRTVRTCAAPRASRHHQSGSGRS